MDTLTNTTATSERRPGPTPGGGVYSVAYFRDAKGNPCPKDRAAQIEIIEYDENDQDIGRTYMTRRT